MGFGFGFGGHPNRGPASVWRRRPKVWGAIEVGVGPSAPMGVFSTLHSLRTPRLTRLAP